MPSRAFVPAPLTEAQPRVYKSFRGRQIQGILVGALGAAISLKVVGAQDAVGYFSTFLAALPGFAYGYYQPHGRPVEYWAAVLWRYYTKSQRWSMRSSESWFRQVSTDVRMRLRALWFVAVSRLLSRKGR